ncbi:flagellar biosynthetic protein FliQ [Acidiphilium sp. AL]|uniref:Flagellar biosynthetic protein FliQ n=1 Tax=Acidiphilium iwatense TaxID=768198 RepID=A0ABS9DXJ7_9PROT|nr:MULTISPECIES: flagellar biosynthetic protein FliQ [Acidiphilium]MCF3947394.1 flagellar biosynthetic protein FliQ [Acidiphilium iwatense]MCU4161719.1 flagellar biosynthetic protein FliQ [Acidiphilium sp. AL]
MTDPSIAVMLHEALYLAARLAGPPLIASLATGLVISLLQAVTQINEASLVFLPKVAAIVGVILVMGGFMQSALLQFAHALFTSMIGVGRS